MRNVIVLMQFFVLLLFGSATVHAAALLGLEVNPNPASPGETLTVGMTVSNSGTEVLTNVVVQLNYPSGLANVNTSSIMKGRDTETIVCGSLNPDICSVGEILIWTVGTIAPGGGVTLQMLPVVDSDESLTSIQFDADLSVDGNLNTQDSRSITIQDTTPIELRIDELEDPVAENSVLRYSLSYGNLGATIPEDALLSFAVPENASFISASDEGSFSDGFVTWDLGSLPSGNTGSREVTLTVDGSEGELIIVDSLALTGTDSNGIDQQAEARRVGRINSTETPEFELSVNPDPVSPEETLTVGMVVSNSGNASLTNVEVHFRYPKQLQSVEDSYILTGSEASTVVCGSLNLDICSAGEIFIWEVGTLASGAGTSLQMLPKVAAIAGGKLIQFEAEVWVDGKQVVHKSRTIQVNESTPVELSIDGLVDPSAEGSQLLYFLNYGNLGATIPDTFLSFVVPEHTSFVSASDEGSFSNGLVTWDLNSLPSGNTGSREVTLTIDGSEGELIIADSLALTGTDSTGIYHQAEVRRVGRIKSTETPEFELSVNPDPVSPEETLTVGMVVSNSGDAPLTNVEVHLRYPKQLQNVTDSYILTGSDTSTVVCGPLNLNICSAGEIFVWEVGTLAPGAGTSLQMLPKVAAIAGGKLIQFEADVWVDGKQVVHKSRTIQVNESTPVELSIDGSVDPSAEGAQLLYFLNYGNLGATIPDTLLSFAVPENASFVSASDEGSFSNGLVTWDLDSLPSGNTGSREVTLTVDGSEGELIIVDSLALTGTDSNGIGQQAEARRVGRINSTETPEFELSVNPDPVSPEETLSVGMVVSNSGDAPLTNVEVHLRYPKQLQNVTDSYILTGSDTSTVVCGPLNLNICSAGEIFVWEVGTLAPGAGTSLQMLPKVAAIAGGKLIQFEAEVWVDGKQVVHKSRTIQVNESTPIELSIDGAVSPVPTGEEIIYDLMFSNLGATLSNTKLFFTIPEHGCFVSASDGGIFDNGSIAWDIGTLQSDSGGTRQIRLIANGGEGELLNESHMELSGINSDGEELETEITRVCRINGDRKPSLTLSFSPEIVLPGETLQSGIVITNNVEDILTNVKIRVRYPLEFGNVNTADMVTGNDTDTIICGPLNTNICSAGEILVWDIGTLSAGGSDYLQMSPQVFDVEEGTQIQFEAEARVDGRQVATTSETVFVGSNFDSAGYAPARADIDNDGFVTLADLILVLQTIAGYDTDLSEYGDCNCDAKIGLPEAVAILNELK